MRPAVERHAQLVFASQRLDEQVDVGPGVVDDEHAASESPSRQRPSCPARTRIANLRLASVRDSAVHPSETLTRDVESVVLAVCGGVVGVMLSAASIPPLSRLVLATEMVAPQADLQLSPAALVVAALASALAAVMFSVAPAIYDP